MNDKPNQRTSMNTSAHQIGILGGTFDPIHLGHITPALTISELLNLDQTLVMPAHIPPHKQSTHVNAAQRYEMVKLACQTFSQLHPDNRELNRTTVSYTIDTLKELKQEFPNSTLYFLMGMDSLLSFEQWFCWQDILTLCHLVVSTRPDYPLCLKHPSLSLNITERFTKQPSQLKTSMHGKILLVAEHDIDISSTQIRQNLNAGIDCANLLPESVNQYIVKHRLYQ